MIPSSSIDVTISSSDTLEQTKTYRISNNKIQGYIEDKDALQQAVYKMLNTEKYEYPIYSFSYGIDLESLISKDRIYVQMELIRRIKDCLLGDERVLGIDNYKFNITEDSILCTFDVKSIYGTVTYNKEVNI